ncbi:MAG: beta-galactosidase [Fervidobacterium sp.]|uniref:Beta-galactosidase n=1 Tax=Fervidobacterium gondwanense DSM 13020 TaxID=1121883 RepID=A0A1M7RQT4_FERGO|nr:beta-galactosidase [Fervidobacterium gondwanense]SHN48589.1 beta-galactosidase [Fervidobacterium gondwanense DSM 13020]
MINRQQRILGEELIVSAEIHYFRLAQEEWEKRIELAKDAGCNTIASYIPWLVHEQKRGSFDFSGNYDVAKFIDLVANYGMYFIARPGPFVMAELKNEGIPYWIYEEKPHLIPVSWNSKKVESAILVYNHPDFISEVERWYAELSKIIKPRLIQNCGNIIAIQLDNEIGMLHWVNNSPDLSDFTLDRFIDWLTEKYHDKLRYGFELEKDDHVYSLLRSPSQEYSEKFVEDYSIFIRQEYAIYVEKLKSIFENLGIDTNFIVNIHGTSGGRGHTFPIGISQLKETFPLSNVFPSTDIYLGEYSLHNFHDLWNINEMMNATSDKVYGSMEFECGSGDYGDNFGQRIDPNSTIQKAALCYIQGNRFLNYYLFSGGTNWKLDTEPFDGNGRIAFTGELHGFAAPVSPDGTPDYPYEYIKLANEPLKNIEKQTAGNFKLVYDDIYVAYLDEYYRTEYTFHNKKRPNIEIRRGYNFWDSFLKSLLIMGYRYRFIDLEKKEPIGDALLIIPAARYMSFSIQKKIVDFVNKGGKVLLYGDLPLYSSDGSPCTYLINNLEISPGEEYNASHKFFLSVYSPKGIFKEFRTYWARELKFEPTDNETEKLACISQIEKPCAVRKGNITVISTEFNGNLKFFEYILHSLGFYSKIKLTGTRKDVIGTFPFLLENENNKFLVVLNNDNYEKNVEILFEGKNIGNYRIKPKEIVFREIALR